MAAERVDRLDVLETDLRRVIELKPDYAHAYNALGYTLADRTDRLDEAYALIEQGASSSRPRTRSSSTAWAGSTTGAASSTRRSSTSRSAYGARPDPEIAAHLGEVLWKLGRKDEASKVWKTALSDHPDHETLLAVIQKFKP